MMDTFQPKHNSESHTCSTVHGEECRSPCIDVVGNLAIQTSKGDVHLQKPVNERQKSSFRTGSRKRQFKSPREGDNDDDNHETIAMIRQQLYSLGGPYENMRINQTDSGSRCSKTSLGNLKRCRDDHEDEEQTAFSQQPAKKARLGSSESRLVALFWHLRIMSNLKPVNGRQKSSFRTGSRKRQFKSPREGDNDDDNHETIAMIRQQLYGPGGPYEHKVQVKSSCDGDNGSNNYETFVMIDNQPPIPGGPDENPIVNQTDSEPDCSNHEDEEETGTSQQPAKKVKRKCKSPREGNNDEDNHESLAMIRQQLHGPGGPDGNMRVNQTESESHCSKTSLCNLKRCRDDHEDEEQTAFSQQPAKKARLGSSDVKHLELSVPYVEEVGQGDAFGKHPAKKTRLGSSVIFDLEISPGFGDMANLQHVNRQSTPSSESGEHKVQDKLSCDGDNGSNDYETFVMTYNQPPIPGGPDENPIVNQTDSEPECSNHEDEEEAGTSQQPAKKVWFASSESRLIAMLLHLTDIPNLKPVNRRQNPIVNQTDSEPECSNDEDEEEAGVSQQPAKKSKRKFL